MQKFLQPDFWTRVRFPPPPPIFVLPERDIIFCLTLYRYQPPVIYLTSFFTYIKQVKVKQLNLQLAAFIRHLSDYSINCKLNFSFLGFELKNKFKNQCVNFNKELIVLEKGRKWNLYVLRFTKFLTLKLPTNFCNSKLKC